LTHTARSSRIQAASSSLLLGCTSAPSAENRSLTAGWASTCPSAALSFSTMSRGVFAGARMPVTVLASKPGTPDSASVGTSGSAAARFAVVTAIARMRPALM
jgi:hypothetical protein